MVHPQMGINGSHLRLMNARITTDQYSYQGVGMGEINESMLIDGNEEEGSTTDPGVGRY